MFDPKPNCLSHSPSDVVPGQVCEVPRRLARAWHPARSSIRSHDQQAGYSPHEAFGLLRDRVIHTNSNETEEIHLKTRAFGNPLQVELRSSSENKFLLSHAVSCPLKYSKTNLGKYMAVREQQCICLQPILSLRWGLGLQSESEMNYSKRFSLGPLLETAIWQNSANIPAKEQ